MSIIEDVTNDVFICGRYDKVRDGICGYGVLSVVYVQKW